ncbi:hypothetical protein BRAO375_3660020 [Bradyrhizobium sp. ORS 375]|nr:hypothetical protein BRAO375_3660020 [Bradyrhizobium sp. ORS 375]
MRAEAALAEGDPMVARRHLAAADCAFAHEIDSLIRDGLFDEAAHRLRIFHNPKFPSLEDCVEHVGETGHYHVQSGSLL